MENCSTIQQGKFTADGSAKVLTIRSDVDWIRVVNLTQSAAQNNAYGFEYYWQRGMGTTGIMKYHPAGDHTMAVNTTASAFTLKDTGTFSLSASNATITAISNAAIPIVSANSTTGVSSGSIVRMGTVATANQLGGMDFSVDTVVANTSFRLPYMSQLAVAGVAGEFRIVEVERSFYPKWRYVTKITKASSAVITMSVAHDFTVGQKVRVLISKQDNAGTDIWGMPEINKKVGTVTAISTANNTITLDIDSSAFTAFAFASNADSAATVLRYPVVVPVGESVASTYANLLDDAVYDGAYIGIELAAGTTSPAGNNDDVIYWVAGKSFSNLAE